MDNVITELMVTTKDNPFNPFFEFNDWYNFDCEKGYFTCSYIDRIANTNSNMSEEMQEKLNNEAMYEIVRINPELYKLVRNETEVKIAE